jgi:hypothetical protein
MGHKMKWPNEDITKTMFLRPLHNGKKLVGLIIVIRYETGEGNKDVRTRSR